MHLSKKVLTFIIIALFHVLCIGDKSERNHRKHVSSLFNTSRVLRHSAKRHMLAHDADSSADEVTFATLGYSKWLASESLVVSPFASGSKVDSNHSTTPGVSTEGSLPDHCHFEGSCNTLSAACICCDFNKSCVYGVDVNVTCHVKDDAKCQGNRSFIRIFNCRYCYQTLSDQHSCQKNTSCHVINAPRQRYIAKCIVKPDVLCLGHRVFAKNILCNWTRGYSWGTALLLSVVFGGFGVDRFYLGMWQEGIGKLFSFGGLGVWTLVDVILIAAGYLGPADGSLYI